MFTFIEHLITFAYSVYYNPEIEKKLENQRS